MPCETLIRCLLGNQPICTRLVIELIQQKSEVFNVQKRNTVTRQDRTKRTVG
uniref:Uncharacterized protein n=1 Tax=Rhizophora mucronata TaxID=61149 RepID=A0A2P2QYS0_RHIMU